MIGYHGHHNLRVKPARRALERVVELLSTCTDCTGPYRIETQPVSNLVAPVVVFDVPPRRHGDWRAPPPPTTFEPLAELVANVERDNTWVTARFDCLLRDPARGEAYGYADRDFPHAWSQLVVFARPASTALSATLIWPTDDLARIVSFHDEVDRLLGVKLSPGKYYRAEVRTKRRDGTPWLYTQRFTFRRTHHVESKPVTEVALLAEIVANPDDDAPRLAYADWLADVGDPRGELIVLQCRLVRLPPGDHPARAELERRERALLSQHGRAWARVPVTRPIFRRGFVESAGVTHVFELVRDLDVILVALPLLRELRVRDEGTARHLGEALTERGLGQRFAIVVENE